LIVESAFLKIPEILLTHESPDMLYEANITNMFTNAVILELNARNIDNPMRKIHMEKRYNQKVNARCDVYLDFSSFIEEQDFVGYGVRARSWVEAKYFGNINRNKGNQTKTENAASIMYDLYRLARYTDENGNKADTKYGISIFNEEPRRYLAFTRQDRSEREWVKALTTPGIHELYYDIEEEAYVHQNVFKDIENGTKVTIKMALKNTVFEPVDVSGDRVYFYGYLNQILDYEIIVDGVAYTDRGE